MRTVWGTEKVATEFEPGANLKIGSFTVIDFQVRGGLKLSHATKILQCRENYPPPLAARPGDEF